jgi:integrase
MVAADFSADPLGALRNERDKLAHALLAPNTQTGYHFDWIVWSKWSARMSTEALPASPEMVGLYATDQLLTGHKVSTVRRRIAAVVHMHRSLDYPSPVTQETRDLLRGARRMRTESIRQVRPLTVENVRAISLLLTGVGTPPALRNRALIVTGFASALRSSNLAALNLEDAEFTEQGLRLSIRRSKTDQEGRGAHVGIPPGKHLETCAANCLAVWIRARGGWPGPLFSRMDGHSPRDRPILPERVGQIVQQLVVLIGLDPRKYGGHSLRAGVISALAEAGASDLTIARQSLHRDMATLKRYVRPLDVFRHNPCELLDL